jgi:hypothetical protein
MVATTEDSLYKKILKPFVTAISETRSTNLHNSLMTAGFEKPIKSILMKKSRIDLCVFYHLLAVSRMYSASK